MFELRTFTLDRLNEVAADWATLAGQDEFDIELAPVFEWCRTHLEHADGDGHALELFDPTTHTTVAILEMVDGHYGQLKKLLRLIVSPEFWNVTTTSSNWNRLVETHTYAYAGVITQGMAGSYTNVKIYGRTDIMMMILTLIKKKWNSIGAKGTAHMRGRWLSIENL